MSTNSSSSSSSSVVGEAVAFDWYMQVFHYHPTQAIAIVTLALFFGITIPLLVQTVRSRRHMILMLIIPLTAIAEGVGFVLRVLLVHNASLSLYIAFTLVVLLSPNALALVNYKVLGYVMEYEQMDDIVTAPPRFRIPLLMNKQGWIHGGRVALLFFLSDIVSFVVQGSGGGMMSAADAKMMDMGSAIIIIGLVFQLVFFTLFTALAIYIAFSPRYHRSSQVSSDSPASASQKPLLTVAQRRNIFIALFLSILLLYIRSIYRLIEFSEGLDGYLTTHEPFFYIFDTYVIFIAFIVYIIFHMGVNMPKHPQTKDESREKTQTPVTSVEMTLP